MSLRAIAKTCKIVGVLVFAALITVVIAVATSDFDHYRREMATILAAATGRKVSLDGHASLTFLPNLALRVTKVRVANAPWGSRAEMARIDEFAARIDVTSLLFSRAIKIDRLVLRGVDLLLETDKKGHGNWELGAAAAEGPPGKALPDFDGVEFRDIRLTYRDGAKGKTMRAAISQFFARVGKNGGLDVRLAAVYAGERVELRGSVGSMAELMAPKAPWPLALEGSVAGITLRVQGSIARPLRGQGIDLEVSLATEDAARPARLIALKPPPRKGYRVAGRLRGNVLGGPLTMNPLTMEMGNSKIAGDVKLVLDGPRPKLIARARDSRVDLADFGVKFGRQNDGADDGRVFSAAPFKSEQADPLDLDIAFKGIDLRLGQLHFPSAAGRLVLAERNLTLDGINAEWGDGRLVGAVAIQRENALLKLTARAAFTQVEVTHFLRLLHVREMIAGKADGAFDIRGQGRSWHEVMASLLGQGDMVMDRGYIASKSIDMIADLLPSLSVNEKTREGSDVVCFAGHFSVEHGVAKSAMLTLDTSRATVRAAGIVDFGQETVDMLLKPHSREARLMTVAVPLRIRGRLSNPDVLPDETVVAAGVAGAVAGTALGPIALLIPLIAAISGTGESPCPGDRRAIRERLNKTTGASPPPARK